MQATSNIATSALLSIVEHAGTAVTILIEGLTQEDLMRSHLTRPEVLRQLKSLADSLARIAPEVRQDMPELDWAGWDAMRDRLRRRSGEALGEALWFACESLVPATLLWLRVYRQSQPGLFLMRS